MTPHILFADDNSDIRELVQIQLRAAGFCVSTTDSATDVLRLVTTERFDVVILDYWMPDGTGIEVCRQIRTFNRSNPILICSGAVTAAVEEAAMRAGAQGFLRKPFNSRELIRALRSALETSPIEFRTDASSRVTGSSAINGAANS
jgi:DNA-binding response OmpR family regulator